MPGLPPRLLTAGYDTLLRPGLFRIGHGDAETAHHATLHAVERLARRPAIVRAAGTVLGRVADPVTVAGIRFPNRVGLAAGVDKDGVGILAWPALGFGHVELGTVTAHPQPGNDKPRVFRLRASQAVINRMGFNNAGAEALAGRLREARRQAGGHLGIPVGVSIGKTKVTPVEEAVADYLTSVRALDGLADYVAVNVSSPNTPGLRSLQAAGALRDLLTALTAEAARLARAREAEPAPVFVKLAPDLTEDALDEAVGVAESSGASGLIATNTTLSRDGIAAADLPLAAEAGGLSGAPLTRRARQVVGHLATRSRLPVIGVGGVMTPDDGLALVDAGASLVQVYTGFIYHGPGLVTGLARALGTRRDRS